jgi:hypothetical protein
MLTGQEQYYLERAGYFVRRAALLPEEVEPLRVAADVLVERCRSDRSLSDLSILNHLFRPEIRETAFVEALDRDAILGPFLDALGTDIRYERAALLVEPSQSPDGEAWHRVLPLALTAPLAKQAAELAQTQHRLQVNLALLPDESLRLMPGTHLEPLSHEQASQVAADPYADLTGRVCVRLQAGDAVFYSPNLLHCGRPEQPMAARRTLQYCVSTTPVKDPVEPQPWLGDSAFLDGLSDRLRPLFDRYLAILRQAN